MLMMMMIVGSTWNVSETIPEMMMMMIAMIMAMIMIDRYDEWIDRQPSYHLPYLLLEASSQSWRHLRCE